MVKFSKFCFASPIDVVVFKCRKNLSDGKSMKSYVIRMTKKIWFPLELSLLRGSRPRSSRASPQHLAHNTPDFIKIGSLSEL